MTESLDPKLPKAEETSATDDASPDEAEVSGSDDGASGLRNSIGIIKADFLEALRLLGRAAADIGIDLELRPDLRDAESVPGSWTSKGLFAELEAQNKTLRALREENIALTREVERRFQELAYLTSLLESARRGELPSPPRSARRGPEDRAKGSDVARRSGEARLRPSTLHIADLTVNSWATTALLNHVTIEDAAGMHAKVWNFQDTDQSRFSWQVRRLQGLKAGLIERGAPPSGAMTFVYGVETYRALLARGDRPASPTAVLVSTRTEMADATALLKDQPPFTRLLRTTTLLFPGLQDPATESWPVALRVGLHDQRKMPARTIPEADIGINLHGKEITKGVTRLIEDLQKRLEKPLLVLADENNKSAARKHAKNVVTADKSRGFWNEFFASLKVFVDIGSTPEKIQVTAAVSQAIQRRRLVVLFCEREAACPGTLTIADKDRLIEFLAETTSSPSLLEERMQAAADAFDLYRGDQFHAGRVLRAWSEGLGPAV
ncbi:hypothetical protein VQH23_24770 [Pararoseomonas sp. SCSIO 73927]|uniref:hypothetical protein n=1 Tax=Pararoseomonas sp. SCSIO 73927 TaxID=3114537 RepID=UPI0030D44EE8